MATNGARAQNFEERVTLRIGLWPKLCISARFIESVIRNSTYKKSNLNGHRLSESQECQGVTFVASQVVFHHIVWPI